MNHEVLHVEDAPRIIFGSRHQGTELVELACCVDICWKDLFFPSPVTC